MGGGILNRGKAGASAEAPTTTPNKSPGCFSAHKGHIKKPTARIFTTTSDPTPSSPDARLAAAAGFAMLLCCPSPPLPTPHQCKIPSCKGTRTREREGNREWERERLEVIIITVDYNNNINTRSIDWQLISSFRHLWKWAS